MTPNQQKFADEYIKCGNATQAYKIAYLNVKAQKVAESSGCRLLSKAKVQEYIKKKNEEILKKIKTSSKSEKSNHDLGEWRNID